MSTPASTVWSGLGLSPSSLPCGSLLTPDEASAALRAPAPRPNFASASLRASLECVAAARAAAPAATRAASALPAAAASLDALVDACDTADAALAACVRDVAAMQTGVVAAGRRREQAEVAAEHVEAFLEEVVLDPALVRHVVDGKVGDGRYVECVAVLRKKVAVFEMEDVRKAKVYAELKPVLDRLVATAAAKVRIFLLGKVQLLQRPNTNVNIIKENVLLRHCELSAFLDEVSPEDFRVVRDAYVHTMSLLYRGLFARYATSLAALKVPIGADSTALALSGSSAAAASAVSGFSLSSAPLVGVVHDRAAQGAAAAAMASTTRSLSGLLGLATRATAPKTVTTGVVSPVPGDNGGGGGGGSEARDGGGGGGDSASVASDSVGRRNSIGSAVEATNASGAAAAAAMSSSASLFSLGNRIDVLAKIASPAIVLAVAENNNLRFYYEEIHRSLGQMLVETWVSEHTFCDAFFGDHARDLFPLLFKDVIATLLEAVTAHASASYDLIGCLLALKVNEAQRTSMQHRNILDLSHYFIRVDIALKPKFKRLFDMNIASLSAATAEAAGARATASGATSSIMGSSTGAMTDFGVGRSDTKPHAVSRQFAELSSSILAIAAYGATDDAIQEGLRRMRSEFIGLLTALSARFDKQKDRYVFLVNNIDLVTTMYASRGLETTSTDMRFFNEIQVGHTAAYVETEVADHFPDLVSFVRDHDRRERAATAYAASTSSAGAGAEPGGAVAQRKQQQRPRQEQRQGPSEAHVRSVLQEFASNWHLGVSHMRDSVLRWFPNFRAGNDILRALFARLFAYHRRCERIVTEKYPALKNELISGTEISYEVRQLSKPFA